MTAIHAGSGKLLPAARLWVCYCLPKIDTSQWIARCRLIIDRSMYNNCTTQSNPQRTCLLALANCTGIRHLRSSRFGRPPRILSKNVRGKRSQNKNKEAGGTYLTSKAAPVRLELSRQDGWCRVVDHLCASYSISSHRNQNKARVGSTHEAKSIFPTQLELLK